MARATANRAVVDGRLLPIRAAKLIGILNDALVPASRVAAVTPVVANTRAELAGALKAVRERGGRVAFVPTMGALHEGHASLMRVAGAAGRRRRRGQHLREPDCSSRPGEDLDRYPRTFDADLELLCAANGVDVVFAPASTRSTPAASRGHGRPRARSATVLEGVTRPTHFRGVLTVVAKLFGLVQPDVAVFGQKDYQQLALIRRMVADLCMGVEIVGAETVREADGLALSSRNRYLDRRPARAGPAPSAGRCAPESRRPRTAPTAVLDSRARPSSRRRRRARLPGARLTRPRAPRPSPARRGCSSQPGSGPPG